MKTEPLEPPKPRARGKVPPVRMIIENLEPKPSQWLMLEYAHAVEIWGAGLTFTNVRSKAMQRRLQALPGTHVSARAVRELDVGRAIILDPRAKRPLTPQDCRRSDALIVGGILGGETMGGRTHTLITRRTKLPSRSLGPVQLPIDIAVFACRAIALGAALEDLEFTDGLTVRYGDGMEVELPYGYPVVDDHVIMTPGLMEYIAQHWGDDPSGALAERAAEE
jgi:ribosome biogenesis SPOUT family RNA methylase Rps3